MIKIENVMNIFLGRSNWVILSSQYVVCKWYACVIIAYLGLSNTWHANGMHAVSLLILVYEDQYSSCISNGMPMNSPINISFILRMTINYFNHGILAVFWILFKNFFESTFAENVPRNKETRSILTQKLVIKSLEQRERPRENDTTTKISDSHIRNVNEAFISIFILLESTVYDHHGHV